MVPAVLTEENKEIFRYAEGLTDKGDLFENFSDTKQGQDLIKFGPEL